MAVWIQTDTSPDVMTIGQQVNTGNAHVPGCQQAERCSILPVHFLDHLQLSLNTDFGAKFRLWGWKGMPLQDAGLSWNIRYLIHGLHKHKKSSACF